MVELSKNILKIKSNLINLKLDPQNIELKKHQIYMILRSKNTYSPNARNPYNIYKHITNLRTMKKYDNI